MKTNLRGKDFISTQEWTKEELETVLHLAFDLKMKWGLDLPSRLLEDKTLFMLFFFSSTRTRNSFEAGMTRLGGHAIFLEPDKMQISHGDTPKEIGKILKRNIQRLGPWTGESCLRNSEAPEAAGIDKAQLAPRRKLRNRVGMFGNLCIRGIDQHSSGHSQVHNPLAPG